MEWARTFAFGPLDLKPWEFYELTIFDFSEMLEGFLWRRKRKEEDLARVLCMMYWVAPSSKRKKAMTPADFMPKEGKEQKAAELDEQGAYLIETFQIPEHALSRNITQKGGE